jgi:RNA polymerase sigma-70 factor (ECF subfamily)
MAQDEDELVHLAAGGDGRALGSLLEAHGPAVRRFLAHGLERRWRPRLDTEDVLQLTFMEAVVHISRFVPRGHGAFGAWLQQIARNNLRDAIRGLRRGKRAGLRLTVSGERDPLASPVLLDGVAARGLPPSLSADSRETAELVYAAVRRLPEAYQRVVYLCDLEGRSVAEAARLLDRSPGAVHMLRARAHDRLRELLGPRARFFGGEIGR